MVLPYGTSYYADASALTKLVIDEKGSVELRAFLEKQGTFYTTTLCFGEVLGVLKRQKRKGELSQHQYISASNRMRSYLASNCVKFIEDDDLANAALFFEAARLSEEHSSGKHWIDLSDALQIVLIGRSPLVDKVLISADADLNEAARKSGITVWNCASDPPPSD